MNLACQDCGGQVIHIKFSNSVRYGSFSIDKQFGTWMVYFHYNDIFLSDLLHHTSIGFRVHDYGTGKGDLRSFKGTRL